MAFWILNWWRTKRLGVMRVHKQTGVLSFIWLKTRSTARTLTWGVCVGGGGWGGGWGGGGGHVKIQKLYFYAPNILIFKNI